MLNELSCWVVDWSAIGAVATACGTLVALGVVAIPSWLNRRKNRDLARALFGIDVTNVMMASLELSGPKMLVRLQEGFRPSESQKRAFSMQNTRDHLAVLGFATEVSSALARLLNSCNEMQWCIENMFSPDINSGRGNCTDEDADWELLLIRARNVCKLAESVLNELYGPLDGPVRIWRINFWSNLWSNFWRKF